MENGVGGDFVCVHPHHSEGCCLGAIQRIHIEEVFWIQQLLRTVGPAAISGFCSGCTAERWDCTVESRDRSICLFF